MEVVVWNIFTKNHVQQQENYLTIKNAQKGSDIIYNIVFLKNTQFSISLPPPTPPPSHTFFKEEEWNLGLSLYYLKFWKKQSFTFEIL